MKFNLAMGLKAGGWSESYDLNYSTIAGAQSSITQIAQFIRLRLYCLGSGAVCVSAVLTADPGGLIVPPRPRRATLSLAVPPPVNAGSKDSAYNKSLTEFPADYAGTRLYFNAQTDPNTTPVYRRNIWIAGIPDASDETNSTLPLPGAWYGAFTQFASGIGGKQTFGGIVPGIVAIRSNDASAGNPVKYATNYGPTTGLFTVPSHGFVSGQLIEAIGFRGNPGQTTPKGYYKVIFNDSNSFGLAKAATVTAVIPPGGFRAVKYVWNPCVSCDMVGFTKRNIGSPFGRPVGRHKAPTIKRA